MNSVAVVGAGAAGSVVDGDVVVADLNVGVDLDTPDLEA